jgi:hypothetical protein
MPIVIELPEDLSEALLADARAQGRDAAAIAIERLAAIYAPEPPAIEEGSPEEEEAIREALDDIATGRMHRFDAKAVLRKHGIS